MVVYVDTLFLTNLIADYLLLHLAAAITGEGFKRWRLFIGAVIGAVYAVAVFLPGLSFLVSFIAKLSSGALIVVTAFGIRSRRSILNLTLCFFIASFILAGGLTAISHLGGGAMSKSLAYYIDVPLPALILAFAAVYLLARLLLDGRGADRRGGRIFSVSVECDGAKADLLALEDSGHELRDPVSNMPVLVTAADTISPALPREIRGLVRNTLASGAADTLLAMSGMPVARRFGLAPVKTAAGEDMLLLFRPDAVVVGETATGKKGKKDMLIGISPHSIGGIRYDSLMGGADDGKGVGL